MKLIVALSVILALDLGCVSLRWSGSGSVIQDRSDHGASKEPMNPWPEWIHRFLWCIVIWVILDHWSWSWSPPKERTLSCRLLFIHFFRVTSLIMCFIWIQIWYNYFPQWWCVVIWSLNIIVRQERRTFSVVSTSGHAQQVFCFGRGASMSRTITFFDSFSLYYVYHTVNHNACFTYNQVFKQKKSSFKCHHVRRQQVEFSNILVHVSAGLRLKVAARNIIGTKQHFFLRAAYVYTWDIISPCWQAAYLFYYYSFR